MRRRFVICTAALLLACQVLSPPTNTPLAPSPSPSPTTTATATATPKPLKQTGYEIRIHPEDGLYVGDLVSFEVIAPKDASQSEIKDEEMVVMTVEFEVNTPIPQTFGPVSFEPFGFQGRSQATFRWEWNTTGLDPGKYELTFRVFPDGPVWTQTINLFPHDALPPAALDAEWISTTTECCLITYLSGTASEREIDWILESANLAVTENYAVVEIGSFKDIHIILMPRVLGQGGFASGEIYVSYLDRNYAGNNFEQILRHEIVHIFDMSEGGDFRPSIFVEGFAVYHTRGHFKPEPLLSRSATLLDLGWYIPLAQLADDFYFQQHEIGYLEAGAFVEYLIERWGYQAFDDFYRDIHPPLTGKDSLAIDAALKEHYGISFHDIEQQFLNALHRIPINPDLRKDVYLSVLFFNTVRRYQENLDPSAHFLTAWLVTYNDIQEHDITADYMRHPSQPENLALETLLISAHKALWENRFGEARRTLAAVNAVLDRIEREHPHPFDAHPQAADHYEIVTLLLEAGYQPQQIVLNGDSALVLATNNGPNLITLYLEFTGNAWRME